MKTCPYCHEQIPDDIIVCPECGERLETSIKINLAKTKKICIAVISILLSISLIVYIAMCFNANKFNETNFKKAFNTLDTVITLSKTADGVNICTSPDLFYSKMVEMAAVKKVDPDNYSITTKDGITYTFRNSDLLGNSDLYSCEYMPSNEITQDGKGACMEITIDVHGLPNLYGKDVFAVYVYRNGIATKEDSPEYRIIHKTTEPTPR